MKKVLMLLVSGFTIPLSVALANPESDLKSFKEYFSSRFSDIPYEDFKNGVYAIDSASRSQWEDVEEFPPYEAFVELGEEEWNKSFANGKDYASCFSGKSVENIRPLFPHWDSDKSRVQTLESALNECRESNGEPKLGLKKGTLAHLSAYLAFEARGKKINVVIPDDPKAIEAYENGKKFFYAKRGQLNLSCADCHVYNAGRKVRADVLSGALGHTTHFPVFRAKWSGGNSAGDGMGTLHRRYSGCNKNVRAKPFKEQSTTYRNLEFFHSYMSNGLEMNGPGYRK